MSALLIGAVIFAVIVLALIVIAGVVLAIVLGRASRTKDARAQATSPPAAERLNPQAFQPPAAGASGGDPGGVT